MVRFLDDSTVIINDYSKEKEHFQRAFKLALDNAGLDYIEIPYNPYDNTKTIQMKTIFIVFIQDGQLMIMEQGVKLSKEKIFLFLIGRGIQ